MTSLAPHPLTLRQLQYVVAIADTRSFREASERCRVSQPALSAQLAALEGALGVRLFERDARRVSETAAGSELVERARAAVRAADEVVAAAQRSRDPLAGRLRLGVIPTISPYLLPSLTPALREAFPKLVSLWVEDKTEVLVRRLAEGSLDAAVLAREAELGDLELEPIASDDFVLVAPPQHALGRGRAPVELAELADVDVLLLDDGHCFRDQALSFCARATAHELEFRATSLPTLVQMVAGSRAVTLLPALAVPVEARRAEIVVRPLAAPTPSRTIVLAWRRRSSMAGALKRLGAAIRDGYPGRTGAQVAKAVQRRER